MINSNTPKKNYIVFICSKCHQYTYAKTNQKGKKCPRCGRNHRISEISGEMVNGLKEANFLVRRRQDEFAENKGEKNQDLLSLTSGFNIKRNVKISSNFKFIINNNNENGENSYDDFLFRLKQLKCNYSILPENIFISYFTNNGLKSSEIKQFTLNALRDKKISKVTKNNNVKYYQINV